MLVRLWPRRTHQELLLDLGERKRWVDEDRLRAAEDFAQWLKTEIGCLLNPVSLVEDRPSRTVVDDAKSLFQHSADPARDDGISASYVALAAHVGATPKTLANSLAHGVRPDRRAHRWVNLFARVARGDRLCVDGWLFHRRTAASIEQLLGDAANRGGLDAGDSLVVHSLIALWQRRRPKTAARGSRGRPLSRRLTPKPVASLAGELIVLGQLAPIVTLAHDLGLRGGALVLLAIECALTEAHLAPHAPRRSSGTSSSTGEQWLRQVDELLVDERVAAIVDDKDLALLRFRVDRMRAWRDRIVAAPPPSSIVTHPYVVATIAIERARAGEVVPRGTVDFRAPGACMLLPQARSLGLVES